ncbi:MAG: sigma-54 dependent transcriptional regulator, partial [Candidatus Sulfobium sp.]
MNGRILIVDDEKDALYLLERMIVAERDYEVLKAESGSEALEMMAAHDVDLVLADLIMPGMDGLELLDRIRESWPEKTFIIMTAAGSIETAVQAIRKGAYDYITKPFQYDELILLIDRALERVRLMDDKRYLQSELEGQSGFSELVGGSEGMLKVYEMIRNVAATSVSVLITGESGTGKELVARAIHFEGRRREGRFIAVNCGGLPETILESEFFGYVKGAFTGALRDKRGLLEEADRGTLFLDEVGDLSPATQVKLLRVLQEGEFRSIGDHKDKKVDLRVISATNKELETEVAKGNFREDLYYRLKVVTISMPPLRDRKDDIPLLAAHFVKKYSKKYEKKVQGVSPSAMRLLGDRHWKGNVRELENAIARAVAVSGDPVINEADLFPGETAGGEEVPGFREARKQALTNFYRTYLASALAKNKGNVSKTAEECSMLRQSLQQIMK